MQTTILKFIVTSSAVCSRVWILIKEMDPTDTRTSLLGFVCVRVVTTVGFSHTMFRRATRICSYQRISALNELRTRLSWAPSTCGSSVSGSAKRSPVRLDSTLYLFLEKMFLEKMLVLINKMQWRFVALEAGAGLVE